MPWNRLWLPFGSWIKFKLPSTLLTILDNSQWPWICTPVLKILVLHTCRWMMILMNLLLRAHHLYLHLPRLGMFSGLKEEGTAGGEVGVGGEGSWAKEHSHTLEGSPGVMVGPSGLLVFLPIYPDFNDSLPLATSQSICLSLTSKGQRHLNWKPLCSCLGATMPQAPQLSHTSTSIPGALSGDGEAWRLSSASRILLQGKLPMRHGW